MPIVYGDILNEGPVIDLMVSVSRARRRLLERRHLSVPNPIYVRALIDTGAGISGFSPRVFAELNIAPVSQVSLYTPSTTPNRPHQCNMYDVILSVIADGRPYPFPGSTVIEVDCWLPDEGIEALLGRDILNKCFFQYQGPDGRFTLAF